MTITALPTPPSRNDPTNFAERGDAFLGALPQFVTEANALQADVNAKQSAASTSATNAATSATNAANSANSAATSATAAGNSATAAATSATNAGNSATAAANSAAAAGTSESNALASKNAAAQSAIDAAASRESLLALSQSIHSGAIVKALFYDTSKDSDGGAWRKRCQDKTWFNESLNGAWLGQAATAAAAWALSGAVTGAYFQNTTDGKFYALGGASPAVTEVFRGNRAEFPEQAAIIAESGRVIIYDLTQSNCPMWMVFSCVATSNWWGSSASVTSVAMLNGLLAVSGPGVRFASFVADKFEIATTTASVGRPNGGISARNSSVSWSGVAAYVIVNSSGNDVAMTVLSDAPSDAATGLPIPIIYVFTAAGVSRISYDGTVSSTATNSPVTQGWVDGSYVRALCQGVGLVPVSYILSAALPAGGASNLNAYWTTGIYSPATVPPFNVNTNGKGVKSAFGSSAGVFLLKENPALQAKSMVAAIANAFNTGWMVGDIRGAWLCDTAAEAVTSSGELISNGAFATDTSGWTAAQNSSLSVVSGAMRVTAVADTTAPIAATSIATVVGKTYFAQAELKTPLAGKNVFLNVSTTQVGSNVAFVNMGTAAGVYSVSFVATSTTTYINFNAVSGVVAGNFFDVDNVMVRLADPDRSVKNKAIIHRGVITKSEVASGAQLVGYSGFSTGSNYLEQLYNSDLDFGTGDGAYAAWFKAASNGAIQMILSRAYFNGSSYSGALLNLYLTNTNTLRIAVSDDGAVTSDVFETTSTFADNVWHLAFVVIRSAVVELWVDGVKHGQVAMTNANLGLTNTSALFRVGVNLQGLNPFGGAIALVRAMATAPSADQLAYIYTTEKMLFQPNAKCTIDGSSTAVTALAYDENEDALHVGTSWGRSKFRDLVRVESAATSVGSITSLSAGQGAHITGGASSARLYQPAMYLREELRRKEEARRALGKMPAFFDFDATTGQTAFALPKGWTVKAVYSAGTLKRLGSTKDYTVSFDGFVETVNFGVAPGNAVWVSVMAVRSN